MTVEIMIPFNEKSALSHPDYYFIWNPITLFRRNYPPFDLLVVEESGKGKEFLKLLDVDGWKICTHKDFPNLSGFPDFHGFVMNESEVLCYKKK